MQCGKNPLTLLTLFKFIITNSLEAILGNLENLNRIKKSFGQQREINYDRTILQAEVVIEFLKKTSLRKNKN